MTAVILRRRMLGKGSANGICAASVNRIVPVRNWVPDDWINVFGHGQTYVFRWGCTSSIENLLSPHTIVNTAKAIHWCSDKRNSRLEMQAAGVPVPQTWTTEDWQRRYDAGDLTGSFVLRPSRHAQGKNLAHGSSHNLRRVLELDDVYVGGYFSALINKVAEYRVFVCQNRAVWVAKKTPGNPEMVAWNVAQGGRFDNVRWGDWPLPVIKAALAAAKVSGTDFCGVDVMVDAEGKPYVLEVNSAPSQTSEYRQRCVAKAFDYIIEHGKQHFDDVPDGRRLTYKSYIHPAVCASERSDPAIRPQE